MVKLMHRTQRGGTIEHTGPPAPPGETVVLSVNEDGIFEAPGDLAECLIRVLSPDVTMAPKNPRPKKESEA